MERVRGGEGGGEEMEHARSSLIGLISSGCLQTERGVSLYKK